LPRFPQLSPAIEAVRATTFSAFGDRLAKLAATGRLVPLHIGDTYLGPPAEAVAAAQLEDVASHLYTSTSGWPPLVAALASYEQVSARQLLITPGATGGLSIVANALLAAGDEVIVLTPCWPLIFGILQRHGVIVREVPVGADGWPDTTSELTQRIAAAIDARTAAIYYCDPNNPVGFVYDPATRDAIAELAQAHGLWIVADRAYAGMQFAGASGHEPLHGAAAERTIVAHTFSKSYGLAGHRVGYLVLPEALAGAMLKVATHLAYHPPTCGQRIATAALAGGDAYPAWLRSRYLESAELARSMLGDLLTCRAPQAAYYLWLDLRAQCSDGEVARAWLGRLLDATGIALAPGSAFGADFARFARLCYTAVAPERLVPALDAMRTWLLADSLLANSPQGATG
jgi:aspartate/methionine/tyrosine aminotransferase